MLVALYIARPFLERSKAPQFALSALERSRDQALSSLLAERDRALSALQELDFDFALGKVPEEDYPVQRTVLLQRGADILRQLDALNPIPPAAATSGAAADAVLAEDRIEAAIAARSAARQSSAPASAASPADNAGTAMPDSDDSIEVMIASRRRSRREKSAGFCPKCGKPVQQSDRFCPKCGAAL